MQNMWKVLMTQTNAKNGHNFCSLGDTTGGSNTKQNVAAKVTTDEITAT